MRFHTAGTKVLPSILGAIGIMLWATETALITYTTAIPPLQTVGLAFGFAAMMSPFVWWITRSSPLEAFRQPPKVWLLTVVSLVGYHACIYYATQNAPPAAAALLQGTTPLIIVIGSAFLPGEKLRWWHLVGAALGLCGVILLIDQGDASGATGGAAFYLSLIGIAAGLWGLYSVVSRSFSDVPSSALGIFYAASALVSMIGHVATEDWVQPDQSQWLAIAGLGMFPMGLAIYFWDFGCKKGDIQALGAFSYVEPFIGAVLVAIIGQGALSWTLFWSGCLVIGGAGIASAGLWRSGTTQTEKVDVENVLDEMHDGLPEISVDVGLAAKQLADEVSAIIETRSLSASEIKDLLLCFKRLGRIRSKMAHLSGQTDNAFPIDSVSGLRQAPVSSVRLTAMLITSQPPKVASDEEDAEHLPLISRGGARNLSLREDLDDLKNRIDLARHHSRLDRAA